MRPNGQTIPRDAYLATARDLTQPHLAASWLDQPLPWPFVEHGGEADNPRWRRLKRAARSQLIQRGVENRADRRISWGEAR